MIVIVKGPQSKAEARFKRRGINAEFEQAMGEEVAYWVPAEHHARARRFFAESRFCVWIEDKICSIRWPWED